ncbi:MAG: hypothetical protein LHV68_06840 [Elusimicrobia bacterium]|nr:hypothetical protein [Candidatus Liberimonas magnetica]
MMILVRNLDKLVTQENLKKTFAAFGVVHLVSIVTEEAYSGPRRFGFVEMNEAEALAAIKALHHIKLFNEIIRVTKANPKFGPDYYAKRKNPPVIKIKTVMPAPLPSGQTARPEFKFGARRRPATDKRAYANSQFAQRNTVRPEYKPGGERPYGRNTQAAGSSRPHAHFKKHDGTRPSFAPRGERGYGYRGTKESAGFPKRDSAGFEHKPLGERPYDRNTSAGNSRTYGHFQKRDSKPGFSPSRKHSYGYHGSNEGVRSGTGFQKHDSAKPEHKTRSERTYGRNSAGALDKMPGYYKSKARKFGPSLFSGKARPK